MSKRRETCLVCEKKLTGKRFIYCSETCHSIRSGEIAHDKISLRRKRQADKCCEVCFKIYKPIRHTQRNCSQECRNTAREAFIFSKRKKINKVECQICKRIFKQKNPMHFNCSAKCRKIDFAQKERNTIRIRPNREVEPVSKHEFTHFQLKNYSFDKILLRKQLEEATIKYLKKNKITVLPDSPSAKVPAVGMTSLSIFGDEREFYEEASMGHLDANLLEMDTNEVDAL